MNFTYQSQDTIELAKALINVQRTVQPVVRGAENPFTKSWCSPSFLHAEKPLRVVSQGLAVRWRARQDLNLWPLTPEANALSNWIVSSRD
ncbi:MULTISPECIES: hypothetical protein [unclassified Desulfovibrio]|uniref:hypothetical protein n=1 Tax=unclassified Desulfovibrio TaxID=2593640 RepID=UPI000F5E6D94|nr:MULTISPECIES: hypothetical protein [unclassified Desulfovibrio]RRD69051.1 hypothetical protein EII24_11550 [Desulfovibrio sp. OH1209_COT-279]RRD84336.1 hypothetical protein EII23_11550 [Desulfovibrio sp. OH1186_COT-070]